MGKNFDVSGEDLLWYGRLQLLFRCTLCPCLRFRSLPAPCLGVPGLLQHVRAGRPYPRQLHAAPRCAHVLRFCKLRHHPQSIRLLRQEYPGPRSYDAMLRGGEHTTHHPLSVRTQRGRAGWAADTRLDAGNVSRLYELNLCMWRYGRGQERKISVLHAMETRAKIIREARARASETVKRRRLAERVVDAGAAADAAP